MFKRKTSLKSKLDIISTLAIVSSTVFIIRVLYKLWYRWNLEGSGPALVYSISSAKWCLMITILFILVLIRMYVKMSSHDREKYWLFNFFIKNREKIIIYSAIILVGLISFYIWYSSAHMANWLWLNTPTGTEPQYNELFTVDSVYDRAFKKIVIFGSYIFGSVFLLLKKNNR
ncbi:hypothetical protein HOB10_00730 [Candidatus Parcubacteria bacterium]|jgi:hypothetical protein|nr:hypothetical protein [Candidatus Parcubacteria bacterium]